MLAVEKLLASNSQARPIHPLMMVELQRSFVTPVWRKPTPSTWGAMSFFVLLPQREEILKIFERFAGQA